MVVNELLADLLVHSGQGVVGAGKVAGQLGQGVLHQALNCQPLLLGDARGEAKSVNGTTNPDPAGVHRGGGVDVALDLVDVHVAGVGRVSADAMVLLDQGVEDIRKHLVLWILQ